MRPPLGLVGMLTRADTPMFNGGALNPHHSLAPLPSQVVYVAPMKALAAEVTSNFSKRLEPLGEGGGG